MEHETHRVNSKSLFTNTTLSIVAVSNISDMNVDTPFNCESPAPTRASIESTMLILADVHGTKLPT